MANFNFNKVILGGRLTADPELKTTPSGIMVTTFNIAVNRRGGKDKTEADFFTITAWRKTAEFITKFFRKGSSICVCGVLENRSWTSRASSSTNSTSSPCQRGNSDGQGITHHVTGITADEAYFVDKRAEMINIPAPMTDAGEYPNFEPLGEFAEGDTQEELPFG